MGNAVLLMGSVREYFSILYNRNYVFVPETYFDIIDSISCQ